MRHLALAVGFASLLAFGTSPASFAQTAKGTPPGATMPPASVAASSQTTSSSPKAEQKKPTKQQLKMKDCAHEAKAKGFKGDVRKQFMSKCLSAE